ncbi:Di-and tricarboxylate transporter [Oscillibacter sp. PC13]|uniref:SLC13 family permease n=1 Tax=Oscillibacter sp. PC13 TaxID=1855299 RepID=UPI0008EA59B0|nr:SLC13 family permease [Oscillibacter sp. PC13]SFP64056.1 Di-and tricarboxylate transporter [Oscillibacter sp. PC13]
MATNDKKTKYSTSYIVNIVITLALMFGFGYLPAFGGITPVGMKVLGVFLGLVYGYTACDIIWPSLFAILAFGICGYTTMGAAITSMMGHNVVFQTLVGFISAGALSYYGFGKWFVRWSLSLKIFKGRPMLYVCSFFVIFGLSSIVVNQIVLSLILYGIWLDIAENCGYEKNSPFVYVGFAGILMCTMLGGAMIPYTSWQFGLAGVWAEVTGSPINFGLMGCITVPCTALTMILYVYISKAIFKIDYSKLTEFDADKLGDESKTLRPRAKRILVVYLISIVVVILANTMMETSFANFINNTLTAAGVYCLCAAILLIMPSGEGDGKGCIEFYKVKDSAISWQVIFMCAVTLPVASAVTNEATGIVPFLSNLFSPIFAGRSGLFILIVTILLSMFLTNVGSNIAFGAAMIPIVAPFVIESGMNPMFAGAAMIYIINIGAVLPGASAPAAIFHSQEALTSGSMRIKVTIVSCLALLIVAIPLFSIASMFLG